MSFQNCNAARRLLIGTLLASVFFIVTAGTAKAEDYPALFNIFTQFVPGVPDADGAVPAGTLKPDASGDYTLIYKQYGNLPGNFRVFIPTGAFKVNVNIYAAQAARVGMAARYGMPLQCDYSQVSYPYWTCFPWDSDGGRLSSMTSADMRFKKIDGTGMVVSDYIRGGLAQGGWLYLKVLDPDPAYDIYRFEYSVIATGDVYRAFHVSGVLPPASSTVSGGCTFSPAADCDPSSGTTPPPSSTGNTNNINPFDFLNNIGNNTNTTNPMDLIGSLIGSGTAPVPATANKSRLDVEIDTTVNGFGGELVVTDSDLEEYGRIVLNPSLKFDVPPSDEVECFAMIVANSAMAFIYRETIFDGSSWLVHGGADRIYRYGSEDISGKTEWACTAFNFLNAYNLPPSFFTQNRLQFIYAIAPVGEVDMGRFENLKYGVISFRPDETLDE